MQGDQAEAAVWTRARLAELLDLTEDQLVEWALILGNDYTLNIPQELLNFPKHARAGPNSVRDGGGIRDTG